MEPTRQEDADGFGGLDFFDYAANRLTLDDWVSVSQIFRPRFVEVRGCVIWERAYQAANFAEWYRTLNGDVSTIEATLNQLRLWQLIDMDEIGTTEERLVRGIADDISSCWRASLASTYPDREFDGGVVETEDGPVVRFSTRRGSVH
ncbi:hypothetical protein QLX52_31740 [Streptomyces albus]|uniref:hypothetical protein n=1 Tax=Streptomyces albus TaxID=1888 RepID=UPI0024AD77D8|nr:hypothetical protein [Streptomyces albus]MDI6413384.1 hypothetical protein [Streptomyces albus]